jgi:dipeptide transport system substrate-binding protein
MNRRLLGAVAAAALAFGFANAATAKTLVYCSEGSPENFNPQINTTGTSLDTHRPVFNRLVQMIPGTVDLEPGLADSWEISDDGLSYTFHLHKGVKFHARGGFTPSRDFNADDVIASFNRMWKADDPYNKVSGGAYDYFADTGMPDLLKSIDKVDDYTVRFVLNNPHAPFLPTLAMEFASIHSAEYMAAMLKAGTPEKVDQEPIGTGPFIFANYKKDDRIVYNANVNYFKGKQPIDRLVFSITPDQATREARLEAGECDIIPYPNPANIEKLTANPNLQVLSQEGFNVGYLAFNVKKPPFDNVKVRQAINMAIDKDSILTAVYKGAGKAAKNPIPPTLWSYDDAIQAYPYDPEKAKAMLAEAGVTSLTTDLWYLPVNRPYNPDGKRIGELIQSDLAKVGITAELKTFEWGEYRKRLQAGEHQMGMLGWTADIGDPDNFMGVLLSCGAAREGGQNIAKWCNEDFNKLLDEARATTDQEKRTEFYKQAQVIFHDQAPWVPIAHSVVHMPMSKKVSGYKVDPLGFHAFEGVDIAE